MQKLSAALLELASRVKRVEDSAAAVEAKNRAKLQARREELEAAIDQSHIELAATATQAKESASTKWSQAKTSIEGRVDEMPPPFFRLGQSGAVGSSARVCLGQVGRKFRGEPWR